MLPYNVVQLLVRGCLKSGPHGSFHLFLWGETLWRRVTLLIWPMPNG
jgi:hypothetical protein